MAINKVKYFGTTLLDLTEDTITEDVLVEGYTAHDMSGAAITGTLQSQTIYTGTTEPSSSLGENGDIYIWLTS